MVRWPILTGLALSLGLAFLARPAPALADEPLYTCAKVAPGAKLTIQFTPDLTLRDLGAWVTGFTCKSVVYDTEAATRATRLALIAPSSVTPRQAVQLFIETVQKAGLVVAEQPDAFVISLPAAAQRRCPAPPAAPRARAATCAKAAAGGRFAVSFKPDATLDDLAIWLTGATCKRVHFDPSVAAGAITANLIVPDKVTPRQAARLFAAAAEATGLVVTEKPDGLAVKPGPAWSHCTTAARPPAPAPAPSDPAVDVDAMLDAGIRKIDDTHYEMKRALVDQIFLTPMVIARSARVVPSMKNGKPDGFKLFGIRPRSLFARIGLRNGDTLQAVNGQRLDSADKALEVYTKVRDAKKLELALTRQGAPVTLTVTITK